MEKKKTMLEHSWFPKIFLNAAKCKTCKRILISEHRHDFVACKCGNFVDGGQDYLRRGGKPEDLEDRSIFQAADGFYYLWDDLNEKGCDSP